MAMTKCRECGAAISDTAVSCPSCGAKPKKPTSKLSIGLAGLALIGVLQAAFKANEAPPPQSKSAADIAAERQFQADVMALRALKSSLKNPASFDLVKAVRLDGGVLCVEYRATNSFNAIIASTAVVTGGKIDSSFGAWNRLCANKVGRDISHARLAV